MDDFLWSLTQNGILDQFKHGDHAFVSPCVNQVIDLDHAGDGERDDVKVCSASKNHSVAEKQRRDRINAHLATLRKFVSNSDKMDKATLLGNVVQSIKQMKSETRELSKVLAIPTHLDEVFIDFDFNTVDPNHELIKATICCEDRAELFSEIKQAIKSLKLTMVQADMTCLGGRILCNFMFCVMNKTSKNDITTLKESLKISLGRIVSSSSWTMSSHYRIKSKRQRFFCTSNRDTYCC
ncbi:hypothetical protein R6Q59_035624 [Mikania micrantha]|uniref:BHLH domain-containing protein n=1 Tax=Mikania micrantha TaxID=192012 RepID=A0A5N6LCJ6_9ASTR|nr:hypothetical protein E3N88_44258 [Mikania micrantha]